MTTKNLKIFHDLNRLDTEEKKKARLAAIEAKLKAAEEKQALEDSGHARAIITEHPREPEAEEPKPVKKAKPKKPVKTPEQVRKEKLEAEIERLRAEKEALLQEPEEDEEEEEIEEEE